ncbi:unnamed protein product [Blepharisma stoltei]|uniref:JmjC domain-containing protein n=1 Tax=Blepharisma stoltei TaxID=1481888 RepID=A0AAU9K8F7_9CILI|nr:unnamed protein product [Blepharisma stoltei]
MNSDQDSSNYDQALTDANSWFELLKDLYAWLEIDPKDAVFKNAKKSKTTLYNLYKEVLEHGGWSNAIGSNSWSSIDKKLTITDSRSMYENFHLVVLEKKHNPSTRYSTGDISLLKEIIPSNLKAVPIVTPSPDGAYDWDTWLEYDLLILRNYVYDVWKIDTKLMSMRSLEEDHSDFPVDILTQGNSELDFKVKSATKETVPMIDYLKIMKQASAQKEMNNKIKFAVNVDLGSWEEEIDEMRRKLPAKILWDSKYDSLKYTRQHILGMTLPQAYLKIKGCWTGGHEENLRFCAANINHGPSDVEWWTLKTSENLKFRDCVMRDYNIDIYITETLWWPDLIYCLSKGFTVYHVVQKPGDLVLVGASAIHWVKSCDVTVNTAWNFGPKTLKNFQLAFERYDINLKINYRNLVPMHILALDLLNHEMSTLPADLVEFLYQKINEAYIEDKKSLEKLPKANISLNQVDNALCCESCYVELFWIYYRCSKCYKNRLKNRSDQECVFCKTCAYKNHKPKCKSTIEVIQKFTSDDFKRFQERVQNVLNKQEFESPLQQELLYPYDKFTMEGVYKSSFTGIETDGSSEENVKIREETKSPVKKSLKARKGKNKAMSYSTSENKSTEKEDFAFPEIKSDKAKKSKIILPPIENIMSVEENKEESENERMDIEEEDKAPAKKTNKSKQIKEEVSKKKDKSQVYKTSLQKDEKPIGKKKAKDDKSIEPKKDSISDQKKASKIGENTQKKSKSSKKSEQNLEEPEAKLPKSSSKKEKVEITQENSEETLETPKDLKARNSSEIADEDIIESKEKNSSNRRRLRTRKPPKKYNQTSLPLQAYQNLAQKSNKYNEEENEANEEEEIKEEKPEKAPAAKLKSKEKEKLKEESEEEEEESEEETLQKKPVRKFKPKGKLKEKLEERKEIATQALPKNIQKDIEKKEVEEEVKEKLPEKRQRNEEKSKIGKKEKKMKINEIIKAESNKKDHEKRNKKDNEEHPERPIEGHGHNKENTAKTEHSDKTDSAKSGLPLKKQKLEDTKEPKLNQEISQPLPITSNAMDIDQASPSQPLPKSISEIFPKIPQKFDIIPKKPKII